MLILERHSGESILINDDTKLTIYYNKGTQIKIGIDAPRHLNIMREELLTSNKNEKSASKKANTPKESLQSKQMTQQKKDSEQKNPDRTEYELTTPNFFQEEKQKVHQVIIKTKRKKRIMMPHS